MIDFKKLVSMSKFTSLPINAQWIFYTALALMNEDGYANLEPMKHKMAAFDDYVDELEQRGFLEIVNEYGDVSVNFEVDR